MSAIVRVLLGCVMLLGGISGAFAHALQPGFLDVSHLAGDSYRVTWRVPDVSGNPMAITARLPENCLTAVSPDTSFDGQGWVANWVTKCPGGFSGGEIFIDGLERQRTDVIVRYPGLTGDILSERLTPDRVSFVAPENPSAYDVLRTYLPLGFKHILEGLDHLLFVFALLLLIPDKWRLVGAITAFTVAHSITMAAATFGLVSLAGPPVEAVIALSIVFLACELIKRDGDGLRLSEDYPWVVSFSFGLLHGFGFAGALREIGIPETDVPLALLSFNVGVELGQLAFVAAIMALYVTLSRVAVGLKGAFAADGKGLWTTAYAIGGIASFWFVERIMAF